MTSSGQMTKLKRPVSLWRIAVGWALVCAGITGIILPVIPGVPLLIAGLVVLSARYRWAAVCVKWVKRKVRQVARRREKRNETVGV
jgi:uncharacterized membrane protein YbaN (DUF454 family)